ncbi:MAG: transposase [Vicinamibacteria bacterium]|nr:transposase [Vicinamibacteria bacterium]
MPCGQGAALGVADVLRDHVASLRLSPEQGKAAAHMMACRTGRLGGHAFVCDRCGERHFAYNSCRDRHCPRCGGLDQAIWAEAQQQHLLPLSYFHLVFTVPASLRPFFLGPGRVHAFEALFAAASETILQVAARRGLLLGVLAVLHTWNQKLDNHPHVHCLVPGGGFGPSGFVEMERFLFSYKLLRRVFKVKLLQRLRVLLKEGVLNVPRASAYLLLEKADTGDWNMKVKRALAGPDAVIKYFARYTKKIGLSDSRVTAYDGKDVTYTYRDRQDGNRVKPARLEAPKFCQRFLTHVLPSGFVRIRRYGFWSNRTRQNRAAMAREALKVAPPRPLQRESRSAACLRIFGKDPARCTKCPDGRLVMVARWSPTRLPMDVLLANLLPRAP